MAPSGKVLICGVNWIGDTIMSMPAIQAYRRLHPDDRLTLLVKPAMRALWEFHDAPDDLMVLESGFAGALRAALRVRENGPFKRAYVLPHSFRSALVPWLAGVPERVGMPGHFRDALLTKVVRPETVNGREHQAYEYLDLLTPEERGHPCAAPDLSGPEDARDAARSLLEGLPSPVVAFLPGAARGPSKQWPREHFIALGRLLTASHGCGMAVLGAPGEKELCDEVALALGSAARSLAGRTGMREWIALLDAVDLVVANDSGGMHVAAALGTPLVALYGLTDPSKTGPLSPRARILQRSEKRERDIERDSPEARAALAAITPEEAHQAARDLLEKRE